MGGIKRYLVLVLIVGVIISGYAVVLFAQEKPKPGEEIIEVYYPDKATKEKIAPFVEYCQCRAAVKNDIGECDKLDSWAGYVNTCQKYFNTYQAFYGNLLMGGRVTSEALVACMNELKGATLEECNSFMRQILAKDTSACDNPRTPKEFIECKAIIKGDIRECGNKRDCIDKALFIKAIRERDIRKCNRIDDNKTRAICKGLISKNEKICEKIKGLKKFRNSEYYKRIFR